MNKLQPIFTQIFPRPHRRVRWQAGIPILLFTALFAARVLLDFADVRGDCWQATSLGKSHHCNLERRLNQFQMAVQFKNTQACV